MISYTDVAVVGAGPAGEAAARAAASTHASVAVIAPSDRPGAAELTGVSVTRAAGERIVRIDGTVASMHRTDIGLDVLVAPKDGGGLLTVAALSVVLANGSRDVTLAFPGSDLDGVYSAREALGDKREQLAGKRLVVAGCGSVVLALAARLAATGAVIAEVVTANQPNSSSSSFSAARWRSALRDRRVLRECGAPVAFGQAIISAQGNARGSVAAVTLAPVDGGGALSVAGARMIECDALVVSAGQAPAIEFAAELGLPLSYDCDGLAFVAGDSYGRTDIPAVMVAGDVAGVYGIRGAQVSGELAGLAAAVPVFGIATQVGKAREVRRLASLNKRLHHSSYAIGEANRLIAAEDVELVLPPAQRLLPATLEDLARLDVPDRDRVLDMKESRLAEHFELASGEPALSSVIFDNAPE